MVPRVFVSSTYYDLKHVRERIEKFIENYGFEPILFESDKVTYQHDKEIDHSAYYEVELCHIMLLIVGGRYGSPSSPINIEEERNKYEDDYVSITRKEFETASKKNIPILIFVEKNVYGEYQTYKENQEHFDELNKSNSGKSTDSNKFKFAHVDSINVFKFIDTLRTKPIKTFEKVEEIEKYIKTQFAGFFYLYLESLKRKSEDSKILDTITELNNVTLRMNEMLSSVGKEILGKDQEEYEKVIESQLIILIDYFGSQFNTYIEFSNTLDGDELDNLDLEKVAKIIYYDALKIDISRDKKFSFDENWKIIKETDNRITKDIQEKLLKISDKLIFSRFKFRRLNHDLHKRVLPFIKNSANENLIIKKIKTNIYYQLSKLPF